MAFEFRYGTLMTNKIRYSRIQSKWNILREAEIIVESTS